MEKDGELNPKTSANYSLVWWFKAYLFSIDMEQKNQPYTVLDASVLF